ncbi:unnamed protein product, partial [marine sediment metagenome]
ITTLINQKGRIGKTTCTDKMEMRDRLKRII